MRAFWAGVGEFLKSKKEDVKIIAIEPEESPYLSLGKAGRHGIEGIGAGKCLFPALVRPEFQQKHCCH